MKNTFPAIAGMLSAAAFLTFFSVSTPLAAQLPERPIHAGPYTRGVAQQAVSASKVSSTRVDFEMANGQKFCIDFYGENIFRLFHHPSCAEPFAPVATPAAEILVGAARRDVGELTLGETEQTFTLTTGRIIVELNRTTLALRAISRATGEEIFALADGPEMAANGSKLALTLRDGEYFYGGGVQNGRFSHRGKSIAIENTNNWVDGGVASPTPFYWSTKGYGVLWHTFKPGRYDFGATNPAQVLLSHSENYLDVFFMVNETPAALLGDFYQLTGQPVLLPKFGFYEGHLNAYNRDYWTPTENGTMPYEDGKFYAESQKDNGGVRESLNGELPGNYQFSARAAIDRYLNNDMPLGWFLPNDGYGAGYGQTTTLEGNIENLRQFGEYAREKGVQIGLWTQSDLHPKEGIEPLLQRDIVGEVRDAGVRVLKTDVAWVGAGYSFGLNGVADVGEIMPREGNNARPFIISLDGWAGTQRYAGIWSGDQTGGDWEYIRFHIPTFIGSGLSGQPNITSDVDGIFGGKNIPVNVREFQWKTFTPMELNMDGWGANPKYPQALGEPATSINRTYLKLKSALMPYAYTIAREAVNGKPIIRAMFLDFPNTFTLGTQMQYQYMWGPSLLVAPIYRNTQMDAKGNDLRNGIYLPEGQWIDYYNGDVYEGGRIINNYDAPLWKLPVFVKAGAIIPMTLPHNTPAEAPADFRAYEVYPDGTSTFTEYDDDGATQAYLEGAEVWTPITSVLDANCRLTLTVAPSTGEYEGFEPMKRTEFRVNAAGAPKKITARVGGKKVKLTEASSREAYENGTNVWFFDEAPELNQFSTPGSEEAKVSIKKNPQVLVRLAATDVTRNEVEVSMTEFHALCRIPGLQSHGALTAPVAAMNEDAVGVYSLSPTWQKVEGADYYEIAYDGMLYSTVRQCSLPFEGLTPETSYTFKVRAVNAAGASDWTCIEATTKSDPYEFAVKEIRATATCADQPGQGVAHLFDFDEKTSWHSRWGKGEAIPFDLTLDLRSVVQLDRIEYQPRNDAGNGTLLAGTYELSTDKQTWSEPVVFNWVRNGELKTLSELKGADARYVRFHFTEGVGNFASGTALYVFRNPEVEPFLQGDINHDKRIDENDLTSYMNYTGLRKGDADFDYVSDGDINHNGLIDAYDISIVSTELDGGVRATTDHVGGSLVLTPSTTNYKAGDEISVLVSGKDLHIVNALSFALPYNTSELEYVGLDLINMKEMVNLTYDRLHTSGQKSLYPTFVNRGNNFLLDEGSHDLFRIKFRAKKSGKFTLSATDGLLIDRSLGVTSF